MDHPNLHPVNRSLDDPMMDNIDHALGRPVDPMSWTFREFWTADEGSKEARALAASPYWTDGVKPARSAGAPRLVFFYVTQAGRKALAAYLDRQNGSQAVSQDHAKQEA